MKQNATTNSTGSPASPAKTVPLPALPTAVGTIAGSRVVKVDPSESPQNKIKRLEGENSALRSKLKAAESDLSAKEVDVSCKLTELDFCCGKQKKKGMKNGIG